MIIKIIIKKIFEELVKEIWWNKWIYYLKGNTFSKRFNDFNNGIEFFKKNPGEMKLEQAKKQKNAFKSNIKINFKKKL